MSVKIRTKKRKDGTKSLYLDIYSNGTRTYEFLKLYLGPDAEANRTTKRLAEVIRSQRQAEISMAPYGVPVPHRQKGDFIAYIDQLADKHTPQTGRQWRTTVSHLKAYTKDTPIPFSSITKAWLEGFREYVLTKVSENTASTYFSHVKAALRAAYNAEIIATNPADKVSGISRPTADRAFLLFEELVQLANTPCPNDEVRRAFLYACYTGLRYSDVAKLHGSDIDNSRLKFRQKKTGNIEHMDLSEQALSFVGKVAPHELVFKMPDYRVVNNIVKQWGIDAKLGKKVTFHVARHTCATLLITAGVDLYTVSKILGHTKMQTTEVYAKIIDQKKKVALAAIPSLPNTIAGGASAS